MVMALQSSEPGSEGYDYGCSFGCVFCGEHNKVTFGVYKTSCIGGQVTISITTSRGGLCHGFLIVALLVVVTISITTSIIMVVSR